MPIFTFLDKLQVAINHICVSTCMRQYANFLAQIFFFKEKGQPSDVGVT